MYLVTPFPFSPNTLSPQGGSHCCSVCCKAGPERRKTANTLREGPKTFQARQDEMLSRDVGIQTLLIWADPFLFMILWILP